MEFRVGRGPIGFIMVLGFILTDSQPGKCIFDPFPSRFQDFGTFPRRLHGLEARYLSGLRPGRPNSDKSGFPGRTEKLRAEKSCRLMVVSHRVLHFSSLLCPFKIVDFQLILLISGASHLRIRPHTPYTPYQGIKKYFGLARYRFSDFFQSHHKQ